MAGKEGKMKGEREKEGARKIGGRGRGDTKGGDSGRRDEEECEKWVGKERKEGKKAQ